MSKQLMKGNEALAEAALRAGCRFYSGYPITPQTEILEYLAKRMDEVGGTFVQTESELAGINMLLGAAAAGARALTSSAGPGFSLNQEGISYLVAADLPAVIINVMRIGTGLGDIAQGQGDYWQMTRGGGHGDYRTIVLAPGLRAGELRHDVHRLRAGGEVPPPRAGRVRRRHRPDGRGRRAQGLRRARHRPV